MEAHGKESQEVMIEAVRRFYRFFWIHTSGRPWTYEIRDWTERHRIWGALITGGVTTAFFTGQMLLTIYFGYWSIPFMVWADFMAFVAGHLFWDSEGTYIQLKEKFRNG